MFNENVIQNPQFASVNSVSDIFCDKSLNNNYF